MPCALALTRRSDGCFLDANDRQRELVGWTRDEVVGRTSVDLGIWASSSDRERFVETLDREGRVQDYETTLRRSDGTVVPVLISASEIDVDGEKCVLSVTTDVTPLKNAQERARRLSRIYTVLSTVNQALVRLSDPSAIFGEACTALVEQGGFVMAWVGMVSSDGARVEPVAWAGAADGYVQNVNAVLSDSARARGPIGRSILENRHIVCADIEHDPTMAPWRESALARGFRAAASFPLVVEDACVGAFVAYAAETDFFDEEQVHLLDELAADVSFALQVAESERCRISAEEALKASEAKFRAAFHASPDLVSITRVSDGRILEVNPGYEHMLGYAREESVGRTTGELSVWNDPADREVFVERLQADGEVTDFETTLRRKDGTLLDVLDSARTIDVDGEPCVVSIVRDITARKAAEVEQRAIAAELKEAQRLARIGSWDWDARTDTITWTAEYRAVLGFDPVLPPPSYEEHLKAYTAESAARLDAAVQRNVETGEPYEVELELAAPQGPTRWIVARSETKIDEHGQITGLRGTAQDITERKLAEEQHRTILETTTDGYWLSDANGYLIEVNDAYCAMTGFSEQELLGMNISQIEVVESGPEVDAHAGRMIGTGHDRFETKHRRKDGSVFDVECSVTYQPDTERFAAFHRDITARKRREAVNRLQGEILGIMGESGVASESLAKVASAMVSEMGLDAVGIRVQEGEDFPYVAQVGLSDSHLSAESSLVSLDARGRVRRDKAGRPLLECTCGLVLSAAQNPSLTPGGSFWTNDLGVFLSLSEAEDPRFRPRNRCIFEGYSSVALVPLRDHGRVFGLIHLASRRHGAFSSETVEMLEGVAAHVGEALARSAADQQVRYSERRYRLISEAVTGFVYSCVKQPDEQYGLDWIAGAVEDLTGYTPEEILDHSCWGFLVLPEDAPLFEENVTNLAPGRSATVEFRIVRKDGTTRWVRSAARASQDGAPLGGSWLVGSCEDVTERKDTEVRLSEALACTIVALSRTVEVRDPYTSGHQQRVSELAAAIAGEMGMPIQRIEEIRTAALIHDIGKMSVPAEILSKPGKLSDVELALIRGHSEAGYQIILT
jgi:PAS domain S-box-containing protein